MNYHMNYHMDYKVLKKIFFFKVLDLAPQNDPCKKVEICVMLQTDRLYCFAWLQTSSMC